MRKGNLSDHTEVETENLKEKDNSNPKVSHKPGLSGLANIRQKVKQASRNQGRAKDQQEEAVKSESNYDNELNELPDLTPTHEETPYAEGKKWNVHKNDGRTKQMLKISFKPDQKERKSIKALDLVESSSDSSISSEVQETFLKYDQNVTDIQKLLNAAENRVGDDEFQDMSRVEIEMHQNQLMKRLNQPKGLLLSPDDCTFAQGIREIVNIAGQSLEGIQRLEEGINYLQVFCLLVYSFKVCVASLISWAKLFFCVSCQAVTSKVIFQMGSFSM